KHLQLLFFVLVFIFTSVALMAEEVIWTSVVSLFIKGTDKLLFTDHFFEVIDQGEYILLPLTTFADYLDIDLEFSNDEQIITVSSDDGSVRIDLEDNLYLDHPEWSPDEPETLDGVFYVSPHVFEHVAHVSVEWKPLYQEISVTLEHVPEWLKPKENKDELFNSNLIREYQILKPATKNGINLLRYKMSSVYAYPYQRASVDVDWEIFGKVNNFSLHANINTNLVNFNDYSSSLKSVRAKYETLDHLLVIGDHESIWDDSLGKKVVRGLSYNYTTGLSSRNIAYKNFSGKVLPQSTVTLFVNNQIISSLSKDKTLEGVYEFKAVPLRPNQLNYVRIVIREPSGEFVEHNYQIAGDPRIHMTGTLSFQTAHGLYRNSSTSKLEGRTHAVSYKLGGGNYSLFADWIWLQKIGCESNNAFRTSLIGQPLNNLLFDLNAYLAPKDDSPSLGSSLAVKLFYARLIGSFNIYSIPEEVASIFPQITGNGKSFTLYFAPVQDWMIEGSVANRNVRKNDTDHQKYQLTIGKTLANPARTLVSLTFTHEKYQHHALNIGTLTNTLTWRRREKTETAQLNSAFVFKQHSFYSGNILGEQNQHVEVNSSGSEMLGNWGVFTHRFNYRNNLKAGLITNQYLNISTSLKATQRKHTGYLTLSLTSGSTITDDKSSFELKDYNVRLIYDYLLRKDLHLSANVTRHEQISGVRDTLDLNLALSYNRNTTVFKSSLGANTNVSGSNQTTISFTSEIQTVLKNGLTLKPKFNISGAFPTNRISYYIGLDLSHSVSFATGVPSFMPYSDDEPKAYVTGRVFLDLNENGVYDKNEPLISDIPVRLDNRIVVTDENGLYVFENISLGEFILSFDPYTLPAEYTPLVEPRLLIVEEMSSTSIDLPLIVRGSIHGLVFLDDNNNGIYDKGNTPLPFATVVLNGDKKTLTSQSGEFLFDRISLGTITLSVDPQSLPPNTEVKDVVITLDEKTNEVNNIPIPVTIKNGNVGINGTKNNSNKK
ncbi:MAG: SdrD B-like domain-containing protein, partial [Firmicutes bacterium]|nr:SdrD B-like domain-containing protein [Bacillota bacterium]